MSPRFGTNKANNMPPASSYPSISSCTINAASRLLNISSSASSNTSNTSIVSMATLSYKLLLASLLISLLFLHHAVEAVEVEAKQQGSLVQMIDCNGACGARCRLSSRPNLCKRACGTCCRRCNCVPPGTAGNQQVCPCYYNMTTHGGRRKCP